MSWAAKVDYAAVKNICERLGVGAATGIENQKARDIVLFALSKDIDMLTSLAERGCVSLYDLHKHGLLPKYIAHRVNFNAPVNKSDCDQSNEYFHKDIGELTKADLARFSSCRNTGKNAVRILESLIDVYRETSGFSKLTNAPLGASEEIALIGRIVEALRKDPQAQRRLRAMFPAQPS